MSRLSSEKANNRAHVKIIERNGEETCECRDYRAKRRIIVRMSGLSSEKVKDRANVEVIVRTGE